LGKSDIINNLGRQSQNSIRPTTSSAAYLRYS